MKLNGGETNDKMSTKLNGMFLFKFLRRSIRRVMSKIS